MTGLLTDRQRAYLAASQEGRDFIEKLDITVARISSEYHLTVLGPAGHGSTSVALKADSRDGEKLVLKLDPDPERSACAASALAAWSGRGVAPQIYYTGESWYLMSWTEGRTVERPLIEQNTQGYAAITALHTAWHTLIPSEAYTDRLAWVLPLTRARLSDISIPYLPCSIVDTAENLLQGLRENAVLGTCHGDPVGGNMIYTPRGTIHLIDPVPHADSLEALIAHWAIRARDGSDALSLADYARSVIATDLDTERIVTWMGIHALTFAAYRAATGRDVPEALNDHLGVFR